MDHLPRPSHTPSSFSELRFWSHLGVPRRPRMGGPARQLSSSGECVLSILFPRLSGIPQGVNFTHFGQASIMPVAPLRSLVLFPTNSCGRMWLDLLKALGNPSGEHFYLCWTGLDGHSSSFAEFGALFGPDLAAECWWFAFQLFVQRAPRLASIFRLSPFMFSSTFRSLH